MTRDPAVPAPQPPAQRPTRFTIWCLLGVVNAGYTVWWLFSPGAAHAATVAPVPYSSGYVWGTLAATAFGLLGLLGYWLMRRWGVYVYSGATLLMGATVLVGAGPEIVAIRMAVVAVFGWFYLRNMA
jgi:hypothetical protein